LATRARIDEAFEAERQRALTVFQGRPATSDRKALARYFLAADDVNSAVLFRMLDGKPFDDLIWKNIRPEVESPRPSS